MEHSIIQWNVQGFQANFEELALLSRRYKPAVWIAGNIFNQFQDSIMLWF